MAKIIQILGPSSSGKDTLKNYILIKNEFFRFNIKDIVLYTTRPPRTGEIEGQTYYFVDDKKMLQLIEEKKVIEKRSYNTEHGIWHYFTCSDKINLDKYNYITANTLEAYDQYVHYYNQNDIIPIMINIEDGIRLQRALNREKCQENPKYAEMCRRFLADSIDFSLENIKKRNIQYFCNNNNDLEQSLSEIHKILIKNL
ncbi:MAG: guanylate kinase [Bacilli bacterium]|nr:guanylate kinase [Bacilli bacterium]